MAFKSDNVKVDAIRIVQRMSGNIENCRFSGEKEEKPSFKTLLRVLKFLILLCKEVLTRLQPEGLFFLPISHNFPCLTLLIGGKIRGKWYNVPVQRHQWS